MSPGLPEKRRDLRGQAVEILGLAFPDHEDAPAHFAECGLVDSITAGVAVSLDTAGPGGIRWRWSRASPTREKPVRKAISSSILFAAGAMLALVLACDTDPVTIAEPSDGAAADGT